MCASKTCVLNQYVCDGKIDCPTDHADEEDCQPNHNNQTGGLKYTICLPFYIRHSALNTSCVPIYTLLLHKYVVLHSKTQFNQYQHRFQTRRSKNKVGLCSSAQDTYPIGKICVFERDIYGNPAHCTDGEHMLFCKKHACPGENNEQLSFIFTQNTMQTIIIFSLLIFSTYMYLNKHKYNKTYIVPYNTTQDNKYVQVRRNSIT